MKTSKILVHKCPTCGSGRVNPVTEKNSYCISCGIEYNFITGQAFTIMYDGALVDCHENEFSNCG